MLASGGDQSVSQPISLAKRDIPIVQAFQTDSTEDKASCSVIDVYYGDGTEGVKRGIVKKIRVVGMEYRTDPAFGNTVQRGFR